MPNVEKVKEKLIGISFVLTPLLLIFGFSAHPNVTSLEVMTSGKDFANEFRGNHLLELGHIAVMFSSLLFMGIMIGLSKMLENKKPWVAFAVLLSGTFGSFMLGVDKGAFALVPSAFDTLSDTEFWQMTPGLNAMINYKGAMWLAQLYVFIPFAIILAGVYLYQTQAIKKWQSIALIFGALLYFNPDIDLISLLASIIISFGLIPIGISYLKSDISKYEP